MTKKLKEELATNNAGGGKVAGIGVGPSGEPPGKTKKRVKGEKKKEIVRRILSGLFVK